MKTCDMANCNNPASYRISLEIRVHPNHPPAQAYLDLVVCEEHSKGIVWEDIVDLNGWSQIVKNFVANGYQKPNKKYSNVKLFPLDEATIK